MSLDNPKTSGAEETWKNQGNIGFAATSPPALHNLVDETFYRWPAWGEPPCPVINVLMKNRDATGAQRGGDLINEFLRRRNK